VVGSWRVHTRRWERVGLAHTWTFLNNGEAAHRITHGEEWDELDETCRWSLEGEVLTTVCPSRTTRTPIVAVGDRIELAPLVRETGTTEPNVLARWTAQIEAHGDVNYDAPGFVAIEAQTVTLYADYRVTIEERRGEFDWETVGRGEYGCAIEAEGEMACRYTPERLAFLASYVDADALERLRSYVMRIPFDESSGEPRFAGQSRTKEHWERM
jgi:hypothetical protein